MQVLWVLGLAPVAGFTQAPSLGLPQASVLELIRETAARVEAARASDHEEVRGLGERVEALLASKAPAATPVEPPQAIAGDMTPLSLSSSWSFRLGGIRGYEFDASDQGRVQTYRELETRKATGAEEVRRLIEMSATARSLEWTEAQQACRVRAVGAARDLVSREKGNPDAYALLGAALAWQDGTGSETLAALQAALAFDAHHPLARALLLEREVSGVFETLVRRRPVALDAKPTSAWSSLLRFHARPPSEADASRFQRSLEALEKELEEVLRIARERRDAASFLRCFDLRAEIRALARLPELERTRPVEPELVRRVALGMEWRKRTTELLFAVFANVELARAAFELAEDDVEAQGVIAFAFAFLQGQMVRGARAGGEPSAAARDQYARMMTELIRIADADESARAARASEAVAWIDLLHVVARGELQHPEMLLRAVRLDPFRPNTLRLLLLAAMSLGEARHAASAAVAEIQLAVVPSLESRRLRAASAARLHDWDTALGLLEACALEAPRDLMVRHQRIVTMLRRNASAEVVELTTGLYGDVTPDNLLRKTASLEDGDRQIFVEAFLLHLVLQGDAASARRLLDEALEKKVLGAAEAQNLRRWIR